MLFWKVSYFKTLGRFQVGLYRFQSACAVQLSTFFLGKSSVAKAICCENMLQML